jgi:hypothetical protein
LSDLNDIGDEFHYVMTCSFFNNERTKYLPYYCQMNANILRLSELFSSHNIVYWSLNGNLSLFITVCWLKQNSITSSFPYWSETSRWYFFYQILISFKKLKIMYVKGSSTWLLKNQIEYEGKRILTFVEFYKRDNENKECTCNDFLKDGFSLSFFLY